VRSEAIRASLASNLTTTSGDGRGTAGNLLGRSVPGSLSRLEPAALSQSETRAREHPRGEPREIRGPGPLTKRIPHGWVLEVLLLGAAGFLHDEFRNAIMGSRADALHNAKILTAIERWMGIYHERAIQHLFLNTPALVAVWNFYYGTAHFVVPIVAAVFLYRKFPARYVRMRNTFLIMLFVTAPLCWAVFPVTPPKYMPKSYGFVDTQVTYWNLGPQKPLQYGADGEPTKGMVDAVGNLYGGMPSHHVSWSLWVVLALWPVVRRRWVKVVLLLHPLLTLAAITITGNHRVIDFAGSAAEVAVAYGLALALERAVARRRARVALDRVARPWTDRAVTPGTRPIPVLAPTIELRDD
jgi:hypothetical protein